MKIIAHRGDSARAPENTLIAFRQANEQGAKWVEFDVMLTADDVPIIFHDNTLSRTTNGKGLVAKTAYKTIAALDAGAWFSADYTGECVPSLLQTIELLASIQLNANIEIKPTSSHCAIKTVDISLNLLQTHWPQDKEPPLISSFNQTCLDYAMRQFPHYPRGLLLSRWRNDACLLAKRYQCQTINLNYKYLNQQRVDEIKRHGLRLYAYTVNDPNTITYLEQLGVDGVFSDYAQ